MTVNILEKLFEHNNWANTQIIQACSILSVEQFDAAPQSSTKGSIRQTLMHLASSQAGYLSLLTLPVDKRYHAPVDFVELQESVTQSGEGLLALAKGENKSLEFQLHTTDGYLVEPWVVMVQVINHATEHREQIKSMLSALGLTPPKLDGWTYGEVTNALIPVSK